MGSIDDKTKIPLFAVICSLPFLVGAIVWLTAIAAKADSAQEEIQGLKSLVLDIRERVIRIESGIEYQKSHGGHK